MLSPPATPDSASAPSPTSTAQGLGLLPPHVRQPGEVYIPAANAALHAIIPRVKQLLQARHPDPPHGSLVMDHHRPSSPTRRGHAVIPIPSDQGTAGDPDVQQQRRRHRFFTPQLTGMMVANAAGVIAPDMSPGTMRVKTTLKVKGFEPLVFHDYLFSPDGFSPGVVGNLRGLRAMVPILFNPFEPARIERFDVEAELTYKTDVAIIDAVRIKEVEVPTEKEIELEVVLRPYDGKRTARRSAGHPRRLAGAVLKVEVASGDQTRPDVAPPTTSGSSSPGCARPTRHAVVATVLLPTRGHARGIDAAEPPDSALDTIRPARAPQGRALPLREPLRGPDDPGRAGRAELTFRVADENL